MYGPFTDPGLNPDSQRAVYLTLLGSTPYWEENLSINSLISCELELGAGVGVGVNVGLGVGVAVGFGVGVGVGVGVRVGVGVGVGLGVGVGVGFIICHPKTSPFVLTLDIASSVPVPIAKPMTKNITILTGVV